jgi:hypothetical protein
MFRFERKKTLKVWDSRVFGSEMENERVELEIWYHELKLKLEAM